MTENVDDNPNIALVIWDRRQDTGFQLNGEVLQVIDISIMSGFIPDVTEHLAQIERKIVVRIDRIQKFSHAIYTDTDLT